MGHHKVIRAHVIGPPRSFFRNIRAIIKNVMRLAGKAGISCGHGDDTVGGTCLRVTRQC